MDNVISPLDVFFQLQIDSDHAHRCLYTLGVLCAPHTPLRRISNRPYLSNPRFSTHYSHAPSVLPRQRSYSLPVSVHSSYLISPRLVSSRPLRRLPLSLSPYPRYTSGPGNRPTPHLTYPISGGLVIDVDIDVRNEFVYPLSLSTHQQQQHSSIGYTR
ncbi:hypothetical protein BDN70DRAFT_884517 [Pholiota conissans]|uniref:Uncharacterized protein n=1 Tax=Pholiota conissans TaxID=109636 RepID=A0A9P5YVM5_9AGAR|nr:hypothetical protein BDN70DRAFT_884517 [Pholiota conissans]